MPQTGQYFECFWEKLQTSFRRNVIEEQLQRGKVHPRTGHKHPWGSIWGGRWSTPRLRRFTPRKKAGTHCTGGWVRPWAGLDGCRISRPHQDSITASSSPQPVAIRTRPSRPTKKETVKRGEKKTDELVRFRHDTENSVGATKASQSTL